MLKRRIIPCLDIAHGQVVKGVAFKHHEVVGDIIALAKAYNDDGADELVFYDILASCEQRLVDKHWIEKIACHIHIPFCVAGGIDSIAKAEAVFASGADKVSINSPALANPQLITDLAKCFGSQSIVVGIDSFQKDGFFHVRQYTGNPNLMQETNKKTLDWAKEVVARGAGELVINCMNQDGAREGYDIEQLKFIAQEVNVPVIASGGAGKIHDFISLFQQTEASGALAASVFHKKLIAIPALKQALAKEKIGVRQ